MKEERCTVCREKNVYTVHLRSRTTRLCPRCIKELDEWLTALKRAIYGEKKKGVDRLQLFRRALVENVSKRGSVYASSLAWRLGLPRVDAYREAVKLARRRGWKITKTPSNHIIVSIGGGEEAVGEGAA